jgi:protein-tyrosine phosphatase
VEESDLVNVLFVCLGNICRSPTAEGVFRTIVAREALAGRIGADSAATGDWHLGKPPDPRSQAVARRRGIELSGLRARLAEPRDFERFDYVLAMDKQNLADLTRICPPGAERRLGLFLDFAGLPIAEVADPYGCDLEVFETVFELITIGAEALLAHLQRTHLDPS